MDTAVRHREGDTVVYRGSVAELHGEMTVMAVYAETYGLASPDGVLFGVRPESVHTEEI